VNGPGPCQLTVAVHSGALTGRALAFPTMVAVELRPRPLAVALLRQNVQPDSGGRGGKHG
jgi:hypothetical protein